MSTFDLAKMRQRLDDEIKKQHRSRSDVARSAGFPVGYLTNVLTREQVPTVDRLHQICEALGVSMSYIMYGVDIPAEADEVFDLMRNDPEKFRALLTLLK